MTTYTTCKRCEGKGRLAHFGHVSNGVCLKCRGAGKVVKTRRVTTLETHFFVIDFRGESYPCGTDKEKAELVHADWLEMNCAGEITSREVKKIEHVPV